MTKTKKTNKVSRISIGTLKNGNYLLVKLINKVYLTKTGLDLAT